jgi:hypothetical protein
MLPVDQLLPVFHDDEVEPTQLIVAALLSWQAKVKINNIKNSSRVFNLIRFGCYIIEIYTHK